MPNVAEAGYFRVLWSEEILAETSRNLVEDVPGLTAKHLDKTFDAMRRVFPEAAVRGYEHLIDSMPPTGGLAVRVPGQGTGRQGGSVTLNPPIGFDRSP